MNGSRHGSFLVTKLALSVFVAMWIRESGLGPPTHVRANSKPSPDKPSQNRPSPARDTPHTDEFDSLEPEPSRTRWPDSYVYGVLYRHAPAAKDLITELEKVLQT